MEAGFSDLYPGAPKILFVGEIHSSHTSSWMGLLDGERLNLRAFALVQAMIADKFDVPTYVPYALAKPHPMRSGENRWRLALRRRLFRSRSWEHDAGLRLAEVIRQWRPDAIHCLGLMAAGLFVHTVRERHGIESIGKLIIQLRGGSDLALNHADPNLVPRLARALAGADAILSDNHQNFELMRKMEVNAHPWPGLDRVPGIGGVDVTGLGRMDRQPTARRRMLLWPKAYESPWSKGVPVLEALKLAWERIQPVEIQMLAVSSELASWVSLLPASMREHITLQERVPRQNVLALMARARVMLSPSLIDGTPNAMWEAMATGALPVVSPLATIVPLVRADENVLFARNLYPAEIAQAIIRAMTDDALAERIENNNRAAIDQLAGADHFRPKILQFYREVIGSKKSVGAG